MPLPHQLLYISRLTFLSVDAKTDPRKYKGYSMTDANETWHMYVPKPYRASDPLSIIAAYPFGQIITSCGDLPYATSVPMYVVTTSTGHTELVGHMARNNPHATTLAAGQKALATFHGPNAYISASWYKDQPTVPTWNYIAAQVRGTLHPIDDAEAQLEIMRTTIAQSEAASQSAWRMEHAPDGKVDSLIPRIRSFRITISNIDAVTKLSQTHPLADQKRVVDALETHSNVQDQEIARHMRNLWPK